MKRFLLPAVFALFALSCSAAGGPWISVGKAMVKPTSSGWSDNAYSFAVSSGSAVVHNWGTCWELCLEDAWISDIYSSDNPYCIWFDGGPNNLPLYVSLRGQNGLMVGGIRAKNTSSLNIWGPGSLSETITAHYGIALSSAGDLNIDGAAVSIVQFSDSGSRGANAAISANGDIMITGSTMTAIHSGAVLGVGTIGCDGEYLRIVGSVVAVCSDIPSDKGAIRIRSGSLAVSHSSVTALATGSGFVADSVMIDTSAIGIKSWGTGVSASDLIIENTAGLVIADGNAIDTVRAEFRSGNNLSVVGNAEKNSAWNAAIHLGERNGSFLHSGGRTKLFAPNGTAFLGDGEYSSSHVGCADLEMSGGTLEVSSDLDWCGVRDSFTASSIASAAGSILQGEIFGEASLSILQNFFTYEIVDSLLAVSALSGSSAKPIRGLYARRLTFSGGTTDVTCQTDANGILFSDNATVSGGKVFVNGKPWAPTVSVSFDANGGTVSTKSRKVSKGAQIGTLPKPTRKGFAFIGWWTKKSGGAQVSAATKVSGSMTFYARWAKTTYNVKFVANGGKGTMSSQKMTYGKAAKLNANKFERDGCVFLGWAKTKNGALAYKNRQAVKNLTANGGDVTLYAQWSKKVSVKFNANGGKVKKNSKTAMTGKKLGPLPTPTRKNWTFDGWWTKKTGGKRVTASTIVKKAMTVYAHWTPIVTITFDPNGGTVSKTKLKKRTYLYKGAFYLDTQGFPTATRATYYPSSVWCTQRYLGSGWPNSKPYWEVSVKKPCSLRLYAIWDPIYRYIWFSELDDYRSFRDGKPLGSLPTPSRSHYDFLGWYSKPDGQGIRITASTIANDSLPNDVYAYWKSHYRTVSFYASDKLMETRQYLPNEQFESLPVPPEIPTTEFKYWRTKDGREVHDWTVYDGSYDALYAKYESTVVLSVTGGQ